MKKTISILLASLLVLSMSAVTFAQSGRKGMSPRAQSTGETVTLKGEIANILKPLAIFKTKDREYTVHLGPVWYWNQENIKLETGKTEISGEREEVDGQWYIYPSKISQGKTTIALVTDNGFPKWANMRFGKGRMGNHRGGSNGRCSSCCGRR